MEFFHRSGCRPSRLGVLAGTFNPPTKAHLELAEAALQRVDEVVWVLPRQFPHKPQFGANFDERIHMLRRITPDPTRYSVAATEAGLFIDIARECRTLYGPDTELVFVCGRDAAQRVTEWNYSGTESIEQMLEEFQLLVAPRCGHYQMPEPLAARVHRLELREPIDHVSSTEVRERIARGELWEHLVPEAILEDVKRIYVESK